MKATIYTLATLCLLMGSAEAHDIVQQDATTDFRESFMRTAFPLTQEMLATPESNSTTRLDFASRVADPEIRTIIDQSPPLYFDAPPHVGATTIFG